MYPHVTSSRSISPFSGQFLHSQCNRIKAYIKFYDFSCFNNVGLLKFNLNISNIFYNRDFCGNPYSKVLHMSMVQNFIVERDWELLAVFMGDEGEIWIYQLNLVTME